MQLVLGVFEQVILILIGDASTGANHGAPGTMLATAPDAWGLKSECFSSLCQVALWGFDDSVAGDDVSGSGGAGAHEVDGAYLLVSVFMPLPCCCFVEPPPSSTYALFFYAVGHRRVVVPLQH